MKKYDFYCYLKPNKLFGQPNRFLIFSVSKLYLWPYLSSLLFLGHLHVPGKVLGSWPVSSLTWVDACMRAKSLQSGSTLCDPITVAHQAPLSMEFFWQEYWSGLPFPSPWDLPNPRIKPVSCIDRRILYPWASKEAQSYYNESTMSKRLRLDTGDSCLSSPFFVCYSVIQNAWSPVNVKVPAFLCLPMGPAVYNMYDFRPPGPCPHISAHT